MRTIVSQPMIWTLLIALSIHECHSYGPNLIRNPGVPYIQPQRVPIGVRSQDPPNAYWPQQQEAPRANEQFSLEIFSVCIYEFVEFTEIRWKMCTKQFLPVSSLKVMGN